jgi:hypothetical protein
MRKLKTSDLFAFARCITQIEIKDELKKIAMEANNVNDITSNGFEIVYRLFEIVCEKKSERPIYELIATLLECKWEEARDMNPIELIGKLKEVANMAEWKAFFKTAVR